MSVVLTTLAATLLIQLGYFMWKLSADSAQPKIGGAPAWEVIQLNQQCGGQSGQDDAHW